MKLIKILFSIVIVFILSQSAQALEVTSLNIKWFGRGGNLHGAIEDEYRAEYIKDYIYNYLPESDVYVFQEITDKNGIYEIMKSFDCFSYDVDSDGHQFVVMCSKKGLLQSFEVNQEVRLNRWGLRAAVIGNYLVEGEKIKVIGVHLKAGKKDTEVRLNQIEALKESYAPAENSDEKIFNDIEKTIIIGDFNTYKTLRTGLELDDNELISLSLGNSFNLIKNKTSTYMGFGGRVFDRAWVRNFSEYAASVIGPCKEGSVEVPYSDTSYYKEFISDHCALKINLK